MKTGRPGQWSLLWLASLLSLSSLGAETNQLDRWVAEALANNPEVRAASNRWAAARAMISGAGALPDPMVGADIERANTSLRSFEDIEYMVQQDVPWFGKRGLATRGAAAEARMAEMEWRMKKVETAAAVKSASCDLWQVWQEIAINLRAINLLDRMEKTAAARYESGKASQADVLKASNEKLKLVENQMELARNRETTIAELSRLLGREQAPSVEEPASLPEPKFRIDLNAIRQLLATKHPSLIGAREGGIAAAQAQLDLAKKAYKPDFQFRVEARQFNGEAGLTEYDTGVFLNLPWFNKRKNDSAVASAKANLDARQDDYEAMRQKEAARAQKLYVGIATLQHHHELYAARLIPQQRTAVEAARASYESGMMSAIEILDAQRMLLDYEMTDAHHIAEAWRLAAELEVLTGGELPQLPAEKAP